ncbi:two-component regulator propeller domain-containing protein [Mucilaginibacter sp. RCC_168]|uniref:hybrid sensor histidine kinase/response regulator transcription factor n=1 Tax=unclassified Mucilaginibacter TaxID=2617802 RepID=UPI00088E1FAE|nr:two-component regulator propeller domain-containing protein [Mucilaginibacter sp. OK268]SDP14688.1 Signal transduction histidine kinase [Mucilaginibacter sp. OK268]
MISINLNGYRRLLLICFFSACTSSSALAQYDLNFTSLTTKNGLSSNTVYTILKDKSGLLWFGTSDGLDKFDGSNVTVYNHDSTKPESIPGNEITSCLEDSKGRIWVGTSGGGIAYYNRKTDNFVRFNGNGLWPSVNNISISAIGEDHFGHIWIGYYWGLKIIDPSTGKITSLTIDPKSSINSRAILKIFEDRQKRMWIGTNNGLFLYNWKLHTFRHFRRDTADLHSLSDNQIQSILQDREGQIWFGTGNGLNRLLPDSQSFEAILHDSSPGSIIHNKIYDLALDKAGRLWVGTEGGVSILDIHRKTAINYVPNRRNNFSLVNKSVRSVYVDDQGIAWLGCFQGGISKYDPNLALFHYVQSDPFDAQGLSAPIVTSFAELRPNQYFIGTDGGGLNLFNRRTDLFKHINIRSKINPSNPNLTVMCLEIDHLGNLWMGTYQNGFFKINTKTFTYEQFLNGPGIDKPNHNEIFCIREDSRGWIWIGTNGGGVNIYDPRTGHFKRYIKNPIVENDRKLTVNMFIRDIDEDRYGNMWIGTNGTGLAYLNVKSDSIIVFNRTNSNLSDDNVHCSYIDQKGNIWVGTDGGGLNLLSHGANRFKHYAGSEGLDNGVIYKILPDSKGLLWLSTNKGISSFDPVKKLFKNFNHYNGVQESPFKYGSGIRASTGELYFGGEDGFNYFNPQSLPTNDNHPSVLLSDFKVSNITVVPGEDAPIKEAIGVAKEIKLDYGQNFSISFVALNYTSPQQNQFSYKLVGFDKDWMAVSHSKTAHYTNISPGTYTFYVRATNNEGVWSDKATCIRIIILPPLWRTVYAYCFYVLVAFSILLFVRHRGIKKIERRFELEQEKASSRQEAEREKREIERLHELDLLKIKFLTNLSHEFRTPISLIMAPADELSIAVKDVKLQRQTDIIKRNARRLLNLVNQLLDFRKMEEQELQLNAAPGDFIIFIKEAAGSFQDLSERKRIDFFVNTELEHLSAIFDHDKIERIIFNLLSNAFKFTKQDGSVNLSLNLAQALNDGCDTLIITIIDTGIGIPLEEQKKIFESFYQHNTAASILNQGSGIGLAIVKEFVALHRGEIEVQSKPQEGTTFIVKIPVVYNETTQRESIQETTGLKNEGQANLPSKQTTNNPLPKPLILLIEDHEELREYLKEKLLEQYAVIEAANGKEGWQRALAAHPHLIISDVNMPEMNGIELCKKIKADRRTSHIGVIMLTAMTAEEDQLRGLQIGANDYLTKPFNLDILNAKIRNLLTYNFSLKDTYSRQIQVVGNEIEVPSQDVKLINNIVKYIEDKLATPELSVEELSRHVCMSRGALYHKVLDLTGLTPVEYIRAVKLERAASLLAKSDLNITQIAYMTGFGTPSYFSRQFKLGFKMLPSDYVALHRKDVKINPPNMELSVDRS